MARKKKVSTRRAANASVDANEAVGGASGVAAGQNTQGAQGAATGATEVSHKAQTDVNSEEAISTYNGYAVQRALRNQDVIDNMTHQLLQGAIETQNMVSKQAVRHSDLAIDRQWNVNETDAFATILAERVAARLTE